LPTFDARWVFYLHLRQHGIDRFYYHRRHLLRPLRPVHLHGDVGVAPPHGLDVRVELPQPHLHLLLGIVAPLLEPPQHLLVVGRAERHVVYLAGDGICPTPDNALNEDFVGNVEEDEAVGRHARLGEGLRLGEGAWEAVEEPPRFRTVGVVEPLLDLDVR